MKTCVDLNMCFILCKRNLDLNVVQTNLHTCGDMESVPSSVLGIFRFEFGSDQSSSLSRRPVKTLHFLRGLVWFRPIFLYLVKTSRDLNPGSLLYWSKFEFD